MKTKKVLNGLAIAVVLALLSGSVPIIGCAKTAPIPAPAPKTAPAASLAPTAKPAPAQSPPAKPIELKFNSFTPATHPAYGYVVKPWLDELEKRSGGRVKIIHYVSGGLAKPEGNYDATIKRLSDISFGTQRVTPGRFPLTEIIYSPGLGLPDVEGYTLALWHIFNTLPEVKAEYRDTRVLFLLGAVPRIIGTTKKPVRTMEDMKGLKINITGGKISVEVIKALGGTPVTMDAGEVYMSLEKGILDGVSWGASSMVGNRAHELLKYITNISLESGCFFFVMNKDAYSGLPADIQKIIDDMSGEWGAKFAGERYNQSELDQWEVIKKKGIEIITTSPQEIARWNKTIEPVAGDEVTALEAKGIPARKVHQELLKFGQQYKK